MASGSGPAEVSRGPRGKGGGDERVVRECALGSAKDSAEARLRIPVAASCPWARVGASPLLPSHTGAGLHVDQGRGRRLPPCAHKPNRGLDRLLSAAPPTPTARVTPPPGSLQACPSPGVGAIHLGLTLLKCMIKRRKE